MTEQPHTDRPGKVAVIVLGMHRSGTSSLAGMLDGLGCRGPATLMPASDTNAAGYYESLPVFRLNDAILTALGSRWDDWRPLRPDANLSPRLAEFHDKASAVIEAEYGDGSLIYLKDPRISMLLPFWQQVLEAAGYRCVYLHTHRSPSEIGASLQRRDNIDPGLSMLAWLSQVLQAERHSRGQVRFFTSYEALLRDPAAVAMAAEMAFGFPWPQKAEAGAGRVNRALRHHNDGARAVLEDGRVPGLIRQTLEILERWAINSEQVEDYPRLDDISAAFDEAEGLFAGAIQALRSRSAQLAPTHAREEALKTEKAALEARLTQVTKDKAMLDEHLTQITQARDEALRDRDADCHAQAQQQQELDMLTDRLIDRDAALAAIRRETLAMTKRATQLEQQSAAATEAARQQQEKLRQEVEVLRGRDAAREEAFKTERAAMEARLTQATKDKAMLDEHLTQITQARDEALRDRDAACHAQAQQQQELDMLTDRLIERDAALAAIRRETLAMTSRATQLEQQNAAATEAARQQLEKLRQEVEVLRGQLEAQRQEFLSSTSWRVSAPVRALGRLVRRR